MLPLSAKSLRYRQDQFSRYKRYKDNGCIYYISIYFMHSFLKKYINHALVGIRYFPLNESRKNEIINRKDIIFDQNVIGYLQLSYSKILGDIFTIMLWYI